MPHVEFSAMPPSARVWVFGAAAPVSGAACDAMLSAVDEHLDKWKAHGTPLVCAREWRDDRFLAVAVNEAATGASGCSIDGLFRSLARIEPVLGTTMLDEARVYWRNADGSIVSGTRGEFRASAAAGEVGADTPVFDTTIDRVGALRAQFEQPARDSWHARLAGV